MERLGRRRCILQPLLVLVPVVIIVLAFHVLHNGKQCNESTRVVLVPTSGNHGDRLADVAGSYPPPMTVVTPVPLPTTEQWSKASHEELLHELVVVSGIEKKHYNESLDMIGSVHHFLPDTPIIIFDLGLLEDQVIALENLRNVQVQKHDFKDYPDFRSLGYAGLGCYAWKPQVINEASKKHKVLMWLDASLRLIEPLTHDGCLESVNKFSFVAPSTHLPRFRAAQFIRDTTLEYFNYTRKELVNVVGFQSGILIFKMDHVGRLLMDKWASCSVDHKCICGGDLERHVGYRDHCDFSLRENRTAYVGCHRYDQSTLTLLSAKQFGIEHADEVKRPNCSKIFKIDRKPSNDWRKFLQRNHIMIFK